MNEANVLEAAFAELEPTADDLARTHDSSLEVACLLSLAITAQGIETKLGVIARALEELRITGFGGSLSNG